ncbi:chromosome partitioning protein, ParB family [Cohaesibacter sp. ES.047]|uniref:ParB N-terminal domain-containing protein n=1 Tax=Cohaesibacter sp. ES.047 TaxID=1798205 RepID=UPI000BB93FF5|nr:ParB N-terminal domain-containing protein [Cohaesibacter sp. ES.047]SNY91367.1 chromosome partitioning protein, ParB family [Cohaesibacter sp. ES.047]
MSDFKTLVIADIVVPERLRMVDDDHALAIQASIVQHGQFNPITVRITPNGERPYTLVAGAHRYRAVELLGEGEEIDALVVKADKDEAIILEIEENLFRNDLSVMDRAIFVETYREAWEKVHGVINPKGGRPKNSDKLSEFSESPVGLLEAEAQKGFSAVCADRLGVSSRSIERLSKISQKLPKSVRKAIANSPIADNQSQLLKLAKIPPEKLKKFPRAFKETSDFVKSLEALEPPAPKPDPVMQQLSALIGAWERAKPEARAKFLSHAALIASPADNPQEGHMSS